MLFMTEGPSAKYKALRIMNAVGGDILQNIYVKGGKIGVNPRGLLGKKLQRTETFGKNIVLVFNGYAIKIHLMMYGTIHIYGLDEKLAKPEEEVRLILKFPNKRVVVYNTPVIEIDYASKIIKKLKKTLGEDPLRDDWDPSRAVKLIMKNRDRKIGDVLLDQRVIAGVGNITRNEGLFRARIHPEKLVRDLKLEEVEKLVRIIKDFMEEFFKRRLRGERLRPVLYVYNRSGKPCVICGHPIKYYRQKPNNRKTFVCENCQR